MLEEEYEPLSDGYGNKLRFTAACRSRRTANQLNRLENGVAP